MTTGDFSKESVGDYLRRERESRRVSLEEISQNTRISRPYLEALERNDFRFFSRREYLLGFLRGYARYIGLDPSDVLKRYEVQQDRMRLQETFQQLPLFPKPGDAGEVDSEKTEEGPVSLGRRKRIPFPRSILIQILILATALALSFYLYKGIEQLDKNGSPSTAESILDKEGKRIGEGKEKSIPPKEDPLREKDSHGRGPSKTASVSSSDPGPAEKPGGKALGKAPPGAPKSRIYGNPESRKYYVPGMKGYEKLKAERRVEFASEEEAIKKGYRKGER